MPYAYTTAVQKPSHSRDVVTSSHLRYYTCYKLDSTVPPKEKKKRSHTCCTSYLLPHNPSSLSLHHANEKHLKLYTTLPYSLRYRHETRVLLAMSSISVPLFFNASGSVSHTLALSYVSVPLKKHTKCHHHHCALVVCDTRVFFSFLCCVFYIYVRAFSCRSCVCMCRSN